MRQARHAAEPTSSGRRRGAMELSEIAVGFAARAVNEFGLPRFCQSSPKESSRTVFIGGLPLGGIKIRFAIVEDGRYPRVKGAWGW